MSLFIKSSCFFLKFVLDAEDFNNVIQWKNRTKSIHQKKRIKDRSDEVNVDVASPLSLFVSDCSPHHAIGGDEEVGAPCVENDCVQISAVEQYDEVACLGDGDRDSLLTSDATDSQSYELGDEHGSSEWKVYWDSFYGRNYFYNVITQESTWQPPLEMEHLAYSHETHNLNGLPIEVNEMEAYLFYPSCEISGDFVYLLFSYFFFWIKGNREAA